MLFLFLTIYSWFWFLRVAHACIAHADVDNMAWKTGTSVRPREDEKCRVGNQGCVEDAQPIQMAHNTLHWILDQHKVLRAGGPAGSNATSESTPSEAESAAVRAQPSAGTTSGGQSRHCSGNL